MKKIKEKILKNKKIVIFSICILTAILTGTILIASINRNNKNLVVSNCVISFDMSGSIESYEKTIECGTTINKPKDPSKEGFDFIGWYINDDPFNFESIINESILLKAKFRVKDDVEIITITFNTNGGTYISPIELKKGTSTNKPINPTLYGYKFIGWYIDNELFDFSNIIENNIELQAKWEKDINNNSINDNTNTISSKKYNCTGTYNKKASDKNISSGTTTNINTLWNTGISYIADYCEIEYKSSNASIAIINNRGEIQTINTGTVKISECIIDKETNYELGCFEANINVTGQKCNYQTSTNTQNNHIEQMTKNETRSWSYGYYFTYDSGCETTFKSSNDNIAKFNNANEMVAINTGAVVMSECIKEKSTNKILECYDLNLTIEESNEEKEEKGNQLLNEINNFYWYLDGYTYAYIYPTVIPWYDHQALVWNSEYIDIENNNFVTTEDTNISYSSSNIHNEFLINPTTFAYDLIDKYKMNVSNNKLYITLGDKTYSFTKYSSKKEIYSNIEINVGYKDISLGESFEFEANVTPSIVDHSLYSSVSGGSISCIDTKISNNKWKFNCTGIEVGKSTIIIIDNQQNISSNNINVNVEYKKIHPISIDFDKDYITLQTGSSEKINVISTPTYANDTITWISSNNDIVVVNNGTITAKKYGTAVITATSENGLSKSINVIVTKKPLEATSTLGISYRCGEYLCASMNYVEITASGGTGEYKYSIKVYKDNILKAEANNSTSNELYFTKENGTFYYEYIVIDSDGEKISGNNYTTINVN